MGLILIVVVLVLVLGGGGGVLRSWSLRRLGIRRCSWIGPLSSLWCCGSSAAYTVRVGFSDRSIRDACKYCEEGLAIALDLLLPHAWNTGQIAQGAWPMLG